MRAFLLLAALGLAFVFFALSSVSEGRHGDAAESGIIGLLLIGAAYLAGRRYVFPRARKLRSSRLM